MSDWRPIKTLTDPEQAPHGVLLFNKNWANDEDFPGLPYQAVGSVWAVNHAATKGWATDWAPLFPPLLGPASKMFQDIDYFPDRRSAQFIYDGMVFLTEKWVGKVRYGGSIIARDQTHAEQIAEEYGDGETVIGQLEAVKKKAG